MTVPTILTITTDKADGDYTAGEVINMQLECSAAITVTGTPLLRIFADSAGGSVDYSYQAGTGTTTLNFRRTALATDAYNSLIPLSVVLSGGTLKNAGAVSLSLTLPAFLQMNVAVGNASSYQTRPNHRRLGMLR